MPATVEDRDAVHRARERLMETCDRDPKWCGARVWGWNEEAETAIRCETCRRTEALQ